MGPTPCEAKTCGVVYIVKDMNFQQVRVRARFRSRSRTRIGYAVNGWSIAAVATCASRLRTRRRAGVTPST